MKTYPITVICLAWLSLCAFDLGDGVYTKQRVTELLEKPQVGSTVLGRVNWGTQLKVEAVEGRWLLVSTSEMRGWLYRGNVSEEKPPEVNENDFLRTSAEQTTAATAARPLMKASADYAKRKSLTSAARDVLWLEQQADTIRDSELRTFMERTGLGEYGK